MAEQSENVTLQEVRQKELEEIENRRRKVGLSTADVEHDLVGLSLSGGGMRSSCFGLGILQAFHKTGLWRFFDYLSTVSGGTYIGSYLSSKVLANQQPFDRHSFPLTRTADKRQSPEVKKFIYSGRYLLQPWTLANKYLIGLFFINVAVFSAMIAMCALVAFLCRCLDYPVIRERARMLLLDFSADLTRPFWPALFFGLAWLIAWIISYWQRGAEAAGRIARRLLFLACASFLVAWALLFGNGDISGVELVGVLSGDKPATLGGRFWGPLVALVVGGLIPFLNPRRLLESGMRPKKSWERYVFNFASVALLVGLPLLIVGFLARENISGYNDHDYRPIVKADIDGWPELCRIILNKADPAAGDAAAGAGSSSTPNAQKLSPLQEPPMSTSARLTNLAVKLQPQLQEQSESRAELMKDGVWMHWTLRDHLQRAHAVLSWLTWADGGRDNPARRYWTARQQAEETEDEFCDVLNRLLQDKDWLRDQHARSADKNLNGLVMDEVPAHDVPKYNRQLLEEAYPKVFHKRSDIRRSVVIVADQQTRLWWFAGASAVFLFAGIWVDLNATSMHRYYRNRIAQAFIVPKDEKTFSPALSEMRTTEYGSPYHLISASVGLFRRNLSEDDSGEYGLRDCNAETDYRWIDSFLFSRLFCGSEVTTYAATKKYETYTHGEHSKIDLAEATALSGAALSPGHVDNWLLAFLMFAMNLRLGQWIPNPRLGRPKRSARVLTLLRALYQKAEDRAYCYVSDGGHSENLGLTQLLKRKCSLIIAVDASHDPQHRFHDLAKAVRIARIHGGVKLVAMEKDPVGDEIEFSTKPLELSAPLKLQGDEDSGLPQCSKHFFMARIVYADKSEGLLIYVKPSFDGDEGVDLRQYRSQHREFPHESSNDQIFEDAQVESYRQLGYHIGLQLCRLLPDVAQGSTLWNCTGDVDAERLRNWFTGREKLPAAPWEKSRLSAAELMQRTVPDLPRDSAKREFVTELLARLRKEHVVDRELQPAGLRSVVEQELGAALTSAVVAVRDSVVDPDRAAADRAFCIRILQTLEDELPQAASDRAKTVDALVETLQHGPSAGIKIAAADALGILGRGFAAAETALTEASQDDNERLRERAAYALQKWKLPRH